MAEDEVTIIPHNNGPYEVRGKIRVMSEGGRVLETKEGETWLCRCGQSGHKPFCDSTHRRVQFRSDLDAKADAPSAGFEDVCANTDVREGELKGVRVGNEPVVLGRVAGQLYAVGGLCTHEMAALEDGELEGKMVRCPLHDSGFDITTGKAVRPPAVASVPTYEVKVEGGRVLVAQRRQ